MVTIKEYKKADSLEEAWQLNQNKNNRIIGGMLWTKMSHGNINTAIDLSGLGLDKIEEDSESFSIGAMVTLRQLEIHDGLSQYTNKAMKEALHSIVGIQFRNVATVGGSIYGRYGFSDVLTMFLVMDSYVELYKGGMVSMAEYSQSNYDRDVIVRIIVKKERACYSYQSVRNTKTDFPVLTCAAVKKEDGTYGFAIGARPMRAQYIADDNGILSEKIDETAIKEFAESVKMSLATGTNTRGTKEYRSHLIEVLVKRSILALRSM